MGILGRAGTEPLVSRAGVKSFSFRGSRAIFWAAPARGPIECSAVSRALVRKGCTKWRGQVDYGEYTCLAVQLTILR